MDKVVRAIKILALASVMVLLLSTAVWAGGGGGAEDEHHGFDWMAFLGKTFNAVALFGGLIFFLRKPIIKLLTQKTLDVKEDIHQREDQLKHTSSQLDDIRLRLQKLEDEISGIKLDAKKSGEDEQKRIEELAGQEAQRVLDLTDAEIDTKMENAVRNLKSRIADLTIEHFKTDIRKELDKKAHEKIIEKNIQISGDIIERE
jgi:F0F1-type ATP synthase membrane subunit b/b'